MPKRIPTPPPPEDEPRYVVVVHPYPLNPNLLLHGDRRTLALWLACCTGKDVLLALYYKPSSPGMVIVEIDRYFDRFESVLGMHEWSKFLKKPTDEDMDKSSKVFWCVHNSGRLVQKSGWKRVDIEEHWFQGWSPSNNMIKHPYPKTTRCEVPPEAKTGMPLCRPLPQDIFPTPPAKPPPPVGSVAWIRSKSSEVSTDVPSSSRKRKGNQPPPTSATVISSTTTTSSGSARPPPPPPSDSPISAWVAEQQRQGNWSKPPPSVVSISSLSPSTISTSSVGSRTPSTWGAHRASARPPGLTSSASSTSGQSLPQFGSYKHFDWSDDVERGFQAAAQDDVQTTTPGTSVSRGPSGYKAPPRRIPAPEGAVDPDQDYEYDEEDVPKRSTADAMKDMFDCAPRAGSVRNNTRLCEVEEEDDDYLAWAYPEAVQTTTRNRTPTGGEAGGKPWDGYYDSRLEPPTKVNIKGGEEWICSTHGPTCNPGICRTRRALERDRQEQELRDKRLKDKEERLARRKKNEEKRERKLAAEASEAHDLPPHLAYRGAGGRRGARGGSGSSSSSSSSSNTNSDNEGDDSQNSDSPAGSGSPSPPPSPPPIHPPESVAGPEEWRDQTLWGEEDEEPPRVSLPTGTARSGASSSIVEGEVDAQEARNLGGARNRNKNNTKNNGNNIIRGTAGAGRQQPASRSTAAPPGRGDATVPASAQTSAWGRGRGRAPLVRPEDARGAANVRPAAASVSGDGPAQSPTSGRIQSVWDTPSATSARNDRSTGPDSEVAPAPKSGQQNGRQRERGRSGSTGASSSTKAPAATSVTSPPPSSAGSLSASSVSPHLVPPPGIFVPLEGGFPTYANTEWGDPIALAQSSRRRKSTSTSGTPSTVSRSAVGTDTGDGQVGGDDNLDSGRGQPQEATGRNAGTGRARRGGGGRNARRRGAPPTAAAAPATTTQEVAPPQEPDVTLPGPDEPWCDENAEW